MKIFSDRPISNYEKLYGTKHREAVRKIKEAVDKKMFIAILGPRRVGKTSIVKTFLNYYNHKHLYFDLSPFIGQRAVSFRALTPTIIGFNTSRLSTEAQLNLAILSLKIKKIKITGDIFEANMISLLREINETYNKFILVFDEAQVLAFLKGISGRGILQLIHNNYENISVILTGSMPGILEKVINPSNAEAPAFARYIEKIEVKRWTKKETIDFLEKGLKQANIEYERRELEEVSESLSNIPGFISYYGLLRERVLKHGEALKEAMENAINLWNKDVEAFQRIYDSPLYITVLQILSETITGANWSEIKRNIAILRGRTIENSVLYRVLKNLIGAGMIEKYDDKYRVIDRPLKIAIIRIKGRI